MPEANAPQTPPEPTPGPWNKTRTSTYEISPIKITIAVAEESSHVPPPPIIPAPSGSLSGERIMEVIQQAAMAIMAKLDQMSDEREAGPPH
jgi:hypothetical protein